MIEATPAQSIVGLAACHVGVGFVASQLQHFRLGDRVDATL
jgi:hypothetical protein